MSLYTNQKIIMLLLVSLLVASCGEDNQALIESRNIKRIGRDTVYKYNVGDEAYKRLGTRFICTETLSIAQYDMFEKEKKIKTMYESKGLFYNLSIDTIYNAEASFKKDEVLQNYQNKIMINCGINYISNKLGDTIHPKEILDSRILKDLNTGNIEKIVIYMDSVEYVLDVSKLKNKPSKKQSY